MLLQRRNNCRNIVGFLFVIACLIFIVHIYVINYLDIRRNQQLDHLKPFGIGGGSDRFQILSKRAVVDISNLQKSDRIPHFRQCI
jgi:hypothetical protein